MEIKTLQTVEELEKVFNFVKDTLTLNDAHIRNWEFYKNQFSQTPEFLIFLQENNNITGALLAVPQGEKELLIGELSVADDARGKGVGSLLLDEIEKRAVAAGKNNILLGSRETAEQFYLKHNYVPKLFIQLTGGGRLNELEKFALENAKENEISWKEDDGKYSKIIINTKAIDKSLQEEANKLPQSHTQYLFSKQL